MIKLLIFDFDGTLVDSKPLLLPEVEKHLKKNGYKTTERFKHDFGDKPLGDALKVLGVEEKVMPFLLKDARNKFIRLAGKIKLAYGARELRLIKTKKIIISNSIEQFIKITLKKNKINFFSEIYGANRFKKKIVFMREIIKKKNLNLREVLYVGDRPIDAELSRKIGCYCVLVNEVSWSSRRDIINSGADFVIEDLSNLNAIVNELNLN